MNSRLFDRSLACARPGVTGSRRTTPRLAQLSACTLAATLAAFAIAGPSLGQPDTAGTGQAETLKEANAHPQPEGSWSGGCEVAFAATGSRVRARCRAHYQRRSKDSYAMQATCATASGKAAQTATLHRVGENKYRGNFHNADYDISGTISVTVSGNSQSVRLSSSSGSALFRLSR